MNTTDRRKHVFNLIELHEAGAFVTERPADICYFTGCTYIRGALLLLEKEGSHKLITPSYSVVEASDTAEGVEIVGLKPGVSPVDNILSLIPEKKKVLLGEITLSTYLEISKIGSTRVQNVSEYIQKIMRNKSALEIDYIRKAVAIAEIGIIAASKVWKTGTSEVDIAAEADYAMRHAGSEGGWFPPHVVSGPRSAYSDASPSHRKIGPGEMGFIDVGPLYKNYAGDITRAFVSGTPTPEQLDILECTIQAQKLAKEALQAGIQAVRLYEIAVEYFRQQRKDQYFPHHLGHGLGILGACPPWIAAGSKDVLEEGDIITLEPGLYVPGIGGCRIEDIYMVTINKFDSISKLSLPWELN